MSCVTKMYPSAATNRLDADTTVSPAMPYGVRVIMSGSAGCDPRGSQMLVLRCTPSRTGTITNRQLNGCIAGDACCATPTLGMSETNKQIIPRQAFVIDDLVVCSPSARQCADRWLYFS